jgi:hypothetical protein
VLAESAALVDHIAPQARVVGEDQGECLADRCGVNRDWRARNMPLQICGEHHSGHRARVIPQIVSLDLATPSIAFRVNDLASTRAALFAKGVQATELGQHSGTASFAFADNEGRWFAVIGA